MGKHDSGRLESHGPSLSDAACGLILLHGRGAGAADIMALGRRIAPESCAVLAPEAHGNTWYPVSFLMPREQNEPDLSDALSRIAGVIATMTEAGIPREKIVLGGFSQGACLSLEYVARNPARHGGVFALSGGLIGPRIDSGEYSGSLSETPVLIGCSDVDPYIPVERVRESAAVMERLGATVDLRIYPGIAHTVVEDELEYMASHLARLA